MQRQPILDLPIDNLVTIARCAACGDYPLTEPELMSIQIECNRLFTIEPREAQSDDDRKRLALFRAIWHAGKEREYPHSFDARAFHRRKCEEYREHAKRQYGLPVA